MAYQPQIEFYQKRQFGDKLNATFVFIRENAWPYLKMQLLIAGPILLISSILVNQLSLGFLSFNEEITASFVIDMFRIYGLTLLITLVTTTIMPVIAYSYMKAYQSKAPEDITVATVTNGFANKFFNLLGFNILTYIVVIIGLFFLIIPGIYLGVVLSIGASIIVFEDNNPIDGFGRAFTLIKEKWWSTFGLIIVMAIIGFVINMLFGLPRSIFFGVKVFTALEDEQFVESIGEMSQTDQLLNVLFSIFETFGNILTYSLTYIALAFQYFNLVERRESRGLVSKIEQMDQQDNEAADEVY